MCRSMNLDLAASYTASLAERSDYYAPGKQLTLASVPAVDISCQEPLLDVWAFEY